ncbi:STAS domain-containing protein [Bacillus sp. FJAT-45037]|uniref:STAS domain-containing protein n=1 Tax=Bacillus sp. FJAT-45037 TaxID=2011007 RepID=UPI000C249A51|nr:STAS domain-containing protein [Bacillus sp. FJAT-45037]
MNLLINREEVGSSLTLHLLGVMDISTTGTLDAIINDIHQDIEEVVIDFSGVEFMDSTGVGSIMNAIFLADSMSFTLKLRGMNDMIDEILEMVGVYKVLESVVGGGE